MPKKFAQMIFQSLIALASGALGLVAALAWNEAIKATIKKIFGDDDSLSGMYIYAITATIIAVVVVLILTKLASKVGGEAVVTREADG
jgi:uncharacterized BrkB/YihY/UPF0761 family membrane protein